MPARCLFVCHTFPPVIGGSAGVYAALAREAQGAIAVLTSRLDPATGREWAGWREADAAAPHPVRRIGLVRPPLPGGALRNPILRHAAWAFRAMRLAVAVALAARSHRADAVCICDDETVGWLVPFVQHLLRRRVLVYCHGDDLVQRDPAARCRRRRWLQAADLVVAAGNFPARQLVELYGIARERVAVLPNGVDLRRFRPLPPDPTRRNALGLEGRRIILAPTRLVPRKGVDRLIETMPRIRAQHPEAILLVAGDGPQRGDLQELAATVGGEATARFLGAVAPEELPALYALAELVVLPNRMEPGESDGVPLVLLEAGASGRPVVAGHAGGSAEVVQDGRNGLLVDGEDCDAIARAVLRLLDDGELATRLGRGGIDAARGAGWDERVSTFLDLCRVPGTPNAHPVAPRS